MKPSNSLRLYRIRLRARLLQECFATLGIAAGVALLFASQVSSASLTSSVAQLSHGIAGKATLQLLARDPHGFPEGILAAVRSIPGVRAAAPLLEAGANAIGPRGSESVEILGADESLSQLGGALAGHTALAPFGGIGAVVLPEGLANTIGVTRFGQEVTLQVAGRAVGAPLYAQLHDEQIGSLTRTPVAIAPLPFVQEMTGLSSRVTRILVQPVSGAGPRVRAALSTLAAGRLNVEPVGYDERLFSRAAVASNQSTALFAAISALVGFLLAFNAMLFAAPQRRRLIVDLRREGYGSQTVLIVILLDGLALGVAACVLGLALGEELSIDVLHSNPAFLSLAFALGPQRLVSWQAVAVAVAGGMLAAIVAVLSPLRDILSGDPLAAAAPVEASVNGRTPGRQALAGLVCLGAATAILLAFPQAAIPGMFLLVGALVLALPAALGAVLTLVKRLAGIVTSPVPHVAVMGLAATRTRAIAIAATGAIATFGSVAIQGAHGDVLAGLEGVAHDTNAYTDVWVSPAGSYDLFHTTPFAPLDQSRLTRLSAVRAVRVYRGGLLNYGERRVLVFAPPVQAVQILPTNQLVAGNPREVAERLKTGGWLVFSAALAAEHHLHIGDAVILPTPGPGRFRLAGLSTDLGWVPGAIVMNASDYARAWASTDPTAYSIVLSPGVSLAVGVSEIERALPPSSGLAVQSAERRTDAQVALSRQALARLGQIATLILITSALAMAAAIGALMWRRRQRLARLKLEGFARVELWCSVLIESVLLLSVGCLPGAALGLYAQQLADHTLADVVNLPIVYSLAPLAALRSLGLVMLGVLAIVAIPGYLAASAPALALQE
jgi:putative ABC transport system permease protein